MPKDQSHDVTDHRRDWWIRICICLLAVFIVSLVGPFSTHERFSLLQRALYWGGLISGCLVVAVLVRRGVFRFLSGPHLRKDIAAAFVLSVIIAPVVWSINVFVIGFDLASGMAFLEHLAIVWAICLVPVTVRFYLGVSEERPAEPAPVVPDKVTTVSSPALLRHVDPALHGAIRRVSANDHQLVIYTEKGEARVRMRFADALTHLQDLEGTQVHRSHWVAFDSIETVALDGRRYVANLQCGMSVPVSPSRLGDLEAAGFYAA